MKSAAAGAVSHGNADNGWPLRVTVGGGTPSVSRQPVHMCDYKLC